MIKNIKIPVGWRMVGDNERIIANDKFWGCSRTGSDDITKWVDTLDNENNNNTPAIYDNVYIRKIGDEPKTIKISAKCSDLMFATIYDGNGKQLGSEHDGYVPDWLGDDSSGDYVNLTIDLATGQILNWKAPSNQDLNKTFALPIKKIANTLGGGVLFKPKGSITIKNKTFASLSAVKLPISNKDTNKSIPCIKKQCSNDSHLKLKRNSLGHFIKMDNIAEFFYPSSVNGKNTFRVVKLVMDTNNTIEGIQCNGENTGYKRCDKSKIRGLFQYKGYIKAGDWS
jgi:hypothetical protein